MTSPPPTPAPTSTETPHRYTAALADAIETRWQARWMDEQTFRMPNPGDADFDASRPKFYCLDMFPYPSGAGLHVGHPEGYTATDIICRYKRMKGFNVLRPMGWDAFGLPAEQYAVQTGVHPAVTTLRAIDNFRRQLSRFGFSYDWSREFATIDPEYYRWTQWIWLKAYESWYDRRADAARPIGGLVAALERGELMVTAEGGVAAAHDPHDPVDRDLAPRERASLRAWSALDAAERRHVIDNQRLAYLGKQMVNWCPKLGTVLANEEVIDGRSERGGYPVIRRPLRQWIFRITTYAERLSRDLALIDWPESTRTMQTEWIGRSEGAEIDFAVDLPAFGALRVYTTRPDTIFGATYMVVAPEHPLVSAALQSGAAGDHAGALRTYVAATAARAEVDRVADTREKTGVFTGVTARNPATGERIPIWAADYVLMGYGHGAIMAVPAHDQRDFQFARRFGLPMREVVETPALAALRESALRADAPSTLLEAARRGALVTLLDDAATDDGVGVNSANAEVSIDGLRTDEAKARIIRWLSDTGIGRRKVNFKLRDWLFSRQRYWGEPFPIVFDSEGNHYPIAEDRLPVVLPELEDYRPIESEEPTPPLGKARAWVETTAGAAGVSAHLLAPETPVRRETNTMPGWAGSCWYYLRFCDPRNDDRFVGREAERYWMVSAKRDGTPHAGGVDLYVGGAEHAVLHLLYARFWHKILFDLGEVSTPEPMGRLFHQGLITSMAYQRADKSLVAIDEVTPVGNEQDGRWIETATGQPVTQVIAKMSKSLKNVINPDDVIAEFGADTFRLYEMYMGPLEASKPWNTRDIAGPFRFLQRYWRLVVDEATGNLVCAAVADPGVERQLQRAIARVGGDIERLAFNTAIAAMFEVVNAATGPGMTRDQLERLTLILAPFAPHLAEEAWSRLGHTSSLAYAPWPTFDPAMLVDAEVEIAVQILGKIKARITVAHDADAKAVEAAALADERVRPLLEGKTIRKVIVVPGRVVNIVV